MKRIITTCLILMLAGNCLFAQQKIKGSYDRLSRLFYPADTNVLVRNFTNGLAPFMIKGHNPYAADSNFVGFIDTAGLVKIKPVYNNCSEFVKRIALVSVVDRATRSTRYGLIDRYGRELIPPVYNGLQKCANGFFFAYTKEGIAIIDEHYNIRVPPGKYKAHSVPPPIVIECGFTGETGFVWNLLDSRSVVQFDDYIGVKAGKKWTVIDKALKQMFAPRYDAIGLFEKGVASARSNGKTGAINAKGNWLIPALYDEVTPTGKNYVYVHKGMRGVVSLKNKIIVPLNYNYIVTFGRGFTANTAEDGADLFDESGKKIGSTRYSYTGFKYPVWGTEEEGHYAYNPQDNKYHRYQAIRDIYISTAVVSRERHIFYKEKNKWGLLDTTGKPITPALYEDFDTNKLIYFADGKYVAVKAKGKWGAINYAGKQVLKPLYDAISPDANMLLIKKDGKTGLLNKSLKQVVSIKYDSLVIRTRDISDKKLKASMLIAAQLSHRWGLINSSEKQLVPFLYDETPYVYNNLAIVRKVGAYGICTLQGRQTVKCKYQYILLQFPNTALSFNGWLLTQQDSFFGLVDPEGKEVVEPVYESIMPMSDYFHGKFLVKKNHKYGLFSTAKEKEIIPAEYADLRFYDNNWGYQYGNKTLIRALISDKYGLIDSLNNALIPVKYRNLDIDYNNTRYLVETYDNTMGIIAADIHWFAKPIYSSIRFDWDTHLYWTELAGKRGLITQEGKEIAEPIYNSINNCRTNLILNKGGKFGVIDRIGRIVLPFEYQNIKCDEGELRMTPLK